MGERLRPPTGPESRETRARKTHDLRYTYRGYYRDDGITRIRIYDRPQSGIPLVIATELPENTNTSITNMCEYLAWEIASTYLPGRVEHEHPFDWVEEYPGDPTHPSHHRREDAFSLARFEDYTPRVVWLGGQRRIRIGQPTWAHVGRDELEVVLGLSLDTDEPR